VGFYINPSRRGPVPGRGGLEGPLGPGSQFPQFGENPPFLAKKGLFQPLPADPPQNPENEVTGPRREGLM